MVSEQLFIRLGNQANSVIHWLVWSSSENEIISSGELLGAEHLNSLADRAGGRPATVLVPGNEVITKQVELPSKASRQYIKALPYTLEEDLAQDVEDLFFAIGDKATQGDKTYINVAICSHKKMQLWLSWLTDAGINCQQMLPDYLALPVTDNTASLLQLGETWIVRQGFFSGCNLPSTQLTDWLGFIVQQAGDLQEAVDTEEDSDAEQEEKPPLNLAHYSPLVLPQNSEFTCIAKDYEVPMQVFAQSLAQQKAAINLRQTQYKQKKDNWKFLALWQNAAVLLITVFILHLLMQGIKTMQMNDQVEIVKAEVRSRFLAVYPNGKRIKTSMIKKQMKSKMGNLAASSDASHFFVMVDAARGAFKSVPDLKPSNVRFDAKRGEIRVQASAGNFASFERFKNEAEKQGLTVEQGSLNNTGDKVSGSLSIIKRQS